MLKVIFAYKSIEHLGGMMYILSGGVRVLFELGPLVYGDEFSTVEVDFEQGKIRTYLNGVMKHDFFISLKADATEKFKNRSVKAITGRPFNYKHRF